MPITILLAIAVFIGILWYKRRNPCNWERTGGHGTLKEFRCKTCGAVAYSARYDGPEACKKDIGDPPAL
ncbi:hypothetical protein ERN12_13995 [Rhodobacteraceae bacterium]|nr:hypothetical protein ERN12_13995 [Paracoccaceae bacterium]